MGDTYIELLVKKPDSKTASLLHNLMIVVGVVFFLAALYRIFFVIPAVLFLGLSFIPNLYTNLEYEYLYLDKELTVDRIRKETSRKTVGVYKLDNLEIMAPKGSSRMEGYKQLQVVDYSSGSEEGHPYEIVAESKGQKIRILIDTSEALLSTIKKTIPRNIYTD